MPFSQFFETVEGVPSSKLSRASLWNDFLPFSFGYLSNRVILLANSHELAEIIVEAVILCYFLRHPFLQGSGTGEDHLLMVSSKVLLKTSIVMLGGVLWSCV